ncbi:MAG TPA: SCO2524 family protein [Pseudonocardiaceae bacterium]|nr:SCO2524 family protein [Pseudonocardiaceae bacterium]
MRIRPRQELLDIWRAVARASFQDGKWTRGGRDRPNSISDAEQLLCIMFPATDPKLASFRLERPDETAEDVLEALAEFGDSIAIPQLLIRIMTEYMERYTGDGGTPIFSGDGYFDSYESGMAPGPEQRELDVVDAFSMSITLTLAALGFTRVFRSVIRREDLRQEVDRLEKLASTRLSAAMVGLLRSFSVNVFDVNSSEGRIMCRRANQRSLPDRQVVADLQLALRGIKSGLRDLTIGSGQTADIDSPSRLFECGWSWGIVKDAVPINTVEEVGRQSPGVAVDSPLLYFTVIALDGIEDLFSPRTRLLGLLNDEQRRLADALQIRWDLTQEYWSAIASLGVGTDRWPLEDLPWRTSDGQESDYFSLLVTSMTVQDLVRRRASDAELGRVVRVLSELANRGRINRRPLVDDPAIDLHSPGVKLRLRGSEMVGDHLIGWLVSNFAPLLLKRTILLAGFVRDTDLRGDLLDLADNVWDHLLLRRLGSGPGHGLWDQPAEAFEQLSVRHDLHSWYFTERVIECLVVAANFVSRPPLPNARLTEFAENLLNEAEHLFDLELLSGSGDAGPSMSDALKKARANLRRAREVLHDRPGSATALVGEVLRELDGLAVARQNVAGGA